MEQALLIGFYLVTLLYSIILHEVSHGVVALWLGDKTAKLAGRLSLEPVRHIDPIGSIVVPLIMILTTGFAFGWAKPVPYNPYNLRWQRWGGVAVAFAGPITNFSLAFIAAVSASFLNIALSQKQTITLQVLTVDWSGLTHTVVGSPQLIIYAILSMIIFWNVLLGTFNLLPIPPLDGSKLIFTIFNVNPQIQMSLERWGFILIFVLLMIPMFNIPFAMLVNSIMEFFYTISF
jgi:Zn-dependent protease